MARKKAEPATGAGQAAGSVTPDEFREMERRVSEGAGQQARDRWARQMDAIHERRQHDRLVNRKMPEIVAALMSPPEAVRLPADFAVAWGSDRACMLGIISRPLAAEETEAVASAMAVLMEHNRRLRLLAQDLVGRLEKACDAVNGVQAHVNRQVTAIRDVWIAGETYLDVEGEWLMEIIAQTPICKPSPATARGCVVVREDESQYVVHTAEADEDGNLVAFYWGYYIRKD